MASSFISAVMWVAITWLLILHRFPLFTIITIIMDLIIIIAIVIIIILILTKIFSERV